MCDNNKGLAQRFAKGEEEAVDVLLGAAVQVAGGFIGKEDGGGVHQGPGDSDALLLPAGQFLVLVLQTAAQAHCIQQWKCL